MPDISVALALLKRPLEAVAAVATNTLKSKIASIQAEANVKKLFQKLNATQKVKTIWNVDRPISISSFYHPVKLIREDGNIRQINNVDELGNNAIVLSGTVGQGKSILLRYLLGREIRGGQRVPVFIELRRTPKSGLEQYIRQTFNDLLSIDGHEEIFDAFANNGKLSLLLDGFDEIDPDHVSTITNSVEHLALKFPSSKIIITSRPNSGISSSPHFHIVSLSPLQTDDLHAFFNKILPKDKDLAARITLAVTESKTHAKSLTSTPLLATLLTIVYRTHQRVPTDFAEFYDELFQILLVRHDRSKSGYERKRKTGFSDREIQQVFEAFAYKSKTGGTSSLSKTKAMEIARTSISAQGLSGDESNFLTDIVKVTCLLQEEGGRVEFLHQSVQDFFAARYVYSRPDDVAQRFYNLVLQQKKWSFWEQVLRFLDQIDRYRASKYFFIPALNETLKSLNVLNGIMDKVRLCEVISKNVGIRQTISATIFGNETTEVKRYSVHRILQNQLYGLEIIYLDIYHLFFGAKGLLSVDWIRCFKTADNNYFLSYYDLAQQCGVMADLQKCIASAVDRLIAEQGSHIERVNQMASTSDFMGL